MTVRHQKGNFLMVYPGELVNRVEGEWREAFGSLCSYHYFFSFENKKTGMKLM